MNVLLTGGHIHDSESAIALFKGIALNGKTILADKAYSCEHIRVFIAEHGASACIPDKSNFRIKHDFDSELYKHRNIVERFFQRIALKISFYLLLLLFTFNLPTAPSTSGRKMCVL